VKRHGKTVRFVADGLQQAQTCVPPRQNQRLTAPRDKNLFLALGQRAKRNIQTEIFPDAPGHAELVQRGNRKEDREQGSVTITRYVCDRCGTAWEYENDKDNQKAGWSVVGR